MLLQFDKSGESFPSSLKSTIWKCLSYEIVLIKLGRNYVTLPDSFFKFKLLTQMIEKFSHVEYSWQNAN